MQPAPDLFSYRKYWASRFGPAPFLPMSRAEIATAVEVGHEFGKMLVAHSRSAESVKRCVEAGVDCIYHCDQSDEAALDMLERVQIPQARRRLELASGQAPFAAYVSCSDSRVPANQITGLEPGEVFVHRNVANVVVHSDLNALSVIQFAVEYLKVEHILVVGHYGCGGVLATLRGMRVGLVDNWLRHVHDVKLRHRRRLDHLPVAEQEDVLCEMNVIEQVGNVALTNVIQDAWNRGQKVTIHGWCYGLKDGLVKDLGVSMSRPDEVVGVFRNALKRYPRHQP